MSESIEAQLPAYYANARPELVALLEPAGLNVLEVGCAAGAMGAALLQKGAAQVVGVDIHEPALARARRSLSAAHRLDLNTLPELPYPEGHFHVMTFADVLEHVVEPAAVLRHLRRWLAEDGRILISIPNVRHASVVLPLLVEGQWDYVDAGILDRTHLRFFTRSSVLRLLADAGFEPDGGLAGLRSPWPRPGHVAAAAEFVKALGGDVDRFLAECDVVQFVLLARAVTVQATPRLTQPGPTDPWSGSRRTRVLVVPDLDNPTDALPSTLPVVARALAGGGEATLAIALPTEALERPPAPAEELGGAGLGLDLLLTEQPRTDAGWKALLSGATRVILTSDRPGLVALAARLGVAIEEAHRDPQLAGERPASGLDLT